MVDSNPNNSEQALPAEEAKSLAADAELSDENLEQFLEEEDPEFSKNLKVISADKNLTMAEIEVTASDQELSDERAFWEAQKGPLKAIFKLSPYMVPRLSLKGKKLAFKFKSSLRALFVRVRNFLSDAFIGTKKFLIHNIKNSRETIKQKRLDFRNRSLRWSKFQQRMYYLTILLVMVTIAFIYISVTKGIFPSEEKDFISSWSEMSVMAVEYNPADTEPFYDNIRSGQNLILIEKMVVNIKRSASSGSNPMAAAEFFLEGNNPDVIIEVKDRESELRDMMQRLMEEFNFDQLESAEGKKKLTEEIKHELNRVLTTGALRRVLIKTLILKN